MYEVILILAFLQTQQACYCVSPIKQDWHQYEEPLKKRYMDMDHCMADLKRAENEVVPREREQTGEAVTVRGSRCQLSALREI